MNGLKKFIDKVVNFENLTKEESERAFQIIMNGGATPAEIAAFLVGLRMKKETIEEIAGAANVMRIKAEKLDAPAGTLDTCGTGGKNLKIQPKIQPKILSKLLTNYSQNYSQK